MVTYAVDVPLLTKLSDRALAAGKIQRQDRDTIVLYAQSRGHSTEQLLEQLADYLKITAQRKVQGAKDAATAVANGQRDAAQKLLYSIQQSSGAPLGSPGRVSFDQATLDAAGGDPMKAALLVVTGKGKATVTADPGQAARARFLAQLTQARKTQNYKALFSTNTPGFDPTLLSPGEFAYWKKTRSQVHDERNFARTSPILSSAFLIPGLIFDLVAAPSAASQTRALESAGLASNKFAQASYETVTAKNAEEQKAGLLDLARGGVAVVATAVSAGAGAVVSGVALAVTKLATALAQTGANYGIDVASGKKGAEVGAITSGATAVLSTAGGLAGGGVGGEIAGKEGSQVGSQLGAETGKLTAQGVSLVARSQLQDKGHGLSQLGPRR